MITIRKFLENSDLWDAIKTIEPYPFIDAQTNQLFIIQYGTMPLYSALENVGVEDLAAMVVKLFGNKWLALLNVEDELFSNILVSRKIETTEQIEHNESKQDSREESNLISAFNDVELIKDTGQDSESSESTTGERGRISETIESDLKDVFNRLPRVEKLNIMETAMQDVANFLKISIY